MLDQPARNPEARPNHALATSGASPGQGKGPRVTKKPLFSRAKNAVSASALTAAIELNHGPDFAIACPSLFISQGDRRFDFHGSLCRNQAGKQRD